MAQAERFEDLDVWQNARKLANLVYDLTGQGAFARDYGLKDQIQRAAVSVMSNIAEGFESRTQALFSDYLGRAKGSAVEVRAQLYLALDRNYITPTQFTEANKLAVTISRQLYRLMKYLDTQPNSRRFRENPVHYEP